MKIDRKGFTLIELLAALVILGLLMAIAAPNIMSILNNQKNTIYVEDAKKLATAAAYKMRGTTDESVTKPAPGSCILMDLSFLDNGDFNDPPQGGAYYSHLSYVLACNTNNTYKYYVQLMECKEVSNGCSESNCTCGSTNGDRGVNLVDVSNFDADGAKTKDFIITSGANTNPGSSYTISNKYSTINPWDGSSNQVLYDANDN